MSGTHRDNEDLKPFLSSNLLAAASDLRVPSGNKCITRRSSGIERKLQTIVSEPYRDKVGSEHCMA